MDKAKFELMLKMVINRTWMGIQNFITYSGFRWPKWNHVLIWITGSALLTFYAMAEFRVQLDEYKSNNEVTLTKIIGQNDSIKPPPIAFCLPRMPAALQDIATHIQSNKSVPCPACEKLANRSWDVWTDMDTTDLEDNEDYQNAVWKAFMEKLLSTSDDSFDILSTNNSDWNQPLLEAVWTFFSCITWFDREGPGGDNFSCVSYHDSFLSNTPRVQNLFYMFLSALCEHMNYGTSATKTKGLCPDVLSSIPTVTFEDGFCFLFLVKDEGFTHLTVDAKSSRGTVWPAINVTGGVNTFDIFADISMITWPTGNNHDFHALYLSESLDGNMLSEQVSVKYLINMVVDTTDTDSCYEDSTPEVCIRNCVLKKIIRLCKCIPFTFRNAVSIPERSKNFSFCNSYHYAECSLNTTNERETCENVCQDPCQYVSYQWHVTRIIYEEHKWRKFRLFVAPVKAPFIQFNMTEKESAGQFTSRVAAIFNLYLGISGLSGVAILVYISDLFRTWFHWKRMSRAAKSQNANMEREEEKGGQQVPRVEVDNEKVLIVEMKQQMDALIKQVQALKHSQHYQYMKQQAMVQKSITKASTSFREDIDHLKVTHKTIIEKLSDDSDRGNMRRSLTVKETRSDCSGGLSKL